MRDLESNDYRVSPSGTTDSPQLLHREMPNNNVSNSLVIQVGQIYARSHFWFFCYVLKTKDEMEEKHFEIEVVNPLDSNSVVTL